MLTVLALALASLALAVLLAWVQHGRRQHAALLHEVLGPPQRDFAAHLAANRAILRDAEIAAYGFACCGVRRRNPYGQATREFVLWEAEYQRVVIELTDDQLPARHRRPRPGPSGAGAH